MFDLQTALTDKGLTSGTKLAEALLERLREVQPPIAELPKVRSLGAKISELRRGKLTWWRNNDAATNALADLLDCAPSDILTTAGAAAQGTILLREFPTLPPLAPGEAPCHLSRSGWLFDALRLNESAQRVWIAAPPGAGKRLVVDYIAAHPHAGPLRAVCVASLRDALDLEHEPHILVVRVEHADPDTDTHALAALARRNARTRVLAPYALPHGASDWSQHMWVPQGDWRRTLIAWASERLDGSDALLDTKQAIDIVDGLDPETELFTTPGELLSFLAVLSEKGPRARKLGYAASSWVDLFALRAQSEHTHWTRQRGRTVLKTLLRTRLERDEVSWAPLSMDAWASLGTAPSSAVSENVISSSRRRATNTSENRHKETASEASRGATDSQANAQQEILSELGVLRAIGAFTYDIYPAWASVGIALERVHEEILNPTSQVWGAWSADASRRALVDRALDALPEKTFCDIITRVSLFETQKLAPLGAVEATFAAVGRRIQDGWMPDPPMMPNLERLGLLQVRLLVDTGAEFLYRPLTRLGDDRDDTAWARWLGEAWTYSITIPMSEAIDPALAFHLPGWFKTLNLSAIPSWLPFVHGEDADDPPRDLVRLHEAARTIVSRQAIGDIPERLLGVFLPGLMLEAPKLGLHLRDAHFDQLFQTTSHRMLARMLRAEPPECAAQVAAYVWRLALADHRDAATAVHRFMSSSPLFRAVAESVEPDAFNDSLAGRTFSHLDSILPTLPLRLRPAALRAWARSGEVLPSSWGAFGDVLRQAGVEDVDLLDDMLTDGHFMVSFNVKKRLWELVPDLALRKTEEVLDAVPEKAGEWFGAAPHSCSRDLIALLETRSSLPGWTWGWLAREIPHARDKATLGHDLMRRTRSAIHPRGHGE